MIALNKHRNCDNPLFKEIKEEGEREGEGAVVCCWLKIAFSNKFYVFFFFHSFFHSRSRMNIFRYSYLYFYRFSERNLA